MPSNHQGGSNPLQTFTPQGSISKKLDAASSRLENPITRITLGPWLAEDAIGLYRRSREGRLTRKVLSEGHFQAGASSEGPPVSYQYYEIEEETLGQIEAADCYRFKKCTNRKL